MGMAKKSAPKFFLDTQPRILVGEKEKRDFGKKKLHFFLSQTNEQVLSFVTTHVHVQMNCHRPSEGRGCQTCAATGMESRPMRSPGYIQSRK